MLPLQSDSLGYNILWVDENSIYYIQMSWLKCKPFAGSRHVIAGQCIYHEYLMDCFYNSPTI